MNHTLQSRHSRRLPIPVTLATIFVAITVLLPSPAHAADYPSWQDVENAQKSEAAKQAEIDRLTSLLDSLKSEAAAAHAIAAQRAAVYENAQVKLDQASYRAKTLEAQAVKVSGQASTSRTRVGRLATGLARFGSGDATLNLLLKPERAGGLLYRLGVMSKLTERNAVALASARHDANIARTLTDRATRARAARTDLLKEAKQSLSAAAEAANAAASRETEQESNRAVLQAQLTVLRDDRAATEADYRIGEQARQQQEQQAAVAPPDTSTDAGQVSGQGWALPVSGWISDRFGPRPDKPVSSSGSFHYATDLAAGCGAQIYAATAGTVSYAGWLGTYGNWVLIDHGNGIQTGYAHIQPAGILVGVVQNVAAGQNIARVGTTGGSSGCHLHFEVRVDGSRIDPEPFMSAKGVHLG